MRGTTERRRRAARDRWRAARRWLRPSGWLGSLVRLLIACAAVGTVLTLLGIDPIDLWRGLWRGLTQGVRHLYGYGEEGLVVLGAVIATGAVVVLPIWGVKRLLRATRRKTARAEGRDELR